MQKKTGITFSNVNMFCILVFFDSKLNVFVVRENVVCDVHISQLLKSM